LKKLTGGQSRKREPIIALELGVFFFIRQEQIRTGKYERNTARPVEAAGNTKNAGLPAMKNNSATLCAVCANPIACSDG
jgi:hypothetical protein